MENNASKEEFIKRQRARLTYLQSIRLNQSGNRVELSNPKSIISKAVKQQYPDLSHDEVQKTTRELVLAPNNSWIKVGEQEIAVEDLQFKIAESIELLNSETDSQQEYFGWFEDCAKILHNMNDGYITDSDLRERNDWLDDSYIREAELMTCMGLYRNSTFPEAKQKYDQIYNKLVKLRQLRNAIKDSTRSESDDQKKREEALFHTIDPQRVAQYAMAINEFQQHDPYWNLPKSKLRGLHMFRGYDDELDGEYDYFYGRFEPDHDQTKNPPKRSAFPFMDKLKEYILFHWDDENDDSASRSRAEELRQRQSAASTQNKDEIQSRILALRLRRHDANSNVEKHIKSFIAARFRNLSSSRTR